MNTIGKRMFKGATVGAGLGAVGGGVYGYMKAQDLIDNPPVDTVSIDGYERPMFVERTVGGNFHMGWDGIDISKTKATFPVRNADGSLDMEFVKHELVSGEGKGTLTWVEHEVKEPVIDRDLHHRGGLNTTTKVQYMPTGETWFEPEVTFDQTVNVAEHIATYAAFGALAGGVGGALVALAVGGGKE